MRATLTEAIQLLQEIGWRNNETWARLRFAQLELAMNAPRVARDIAENVLTITREYEFDDDAAEANLVLGHAAYALDDLERARAYHIRARDQMLAVNEETIIAEAWTGLARIALRQADTSRALEYSEPILAVLERYRGFALYEPLRCYLTCYPALCANEDARAVRILHEAYQMLQTRAAMLEDNITRRGYLETVTAHRELTAIFNLQIHHSGV